jgi:anti-sigma factor RsiW
MAKITRLSAEQRENLVAYLDGELDEPGTQEVEQVLAESPVARHEVDMLSRTWDLLAVLPGAKASEDFSRKTLTSIRAAEGTRTSIDGDAVSRQIRRTVVLSAAVVLLAICGVAAFRGMKSVVPNEADLLLRDFDVIEHLDEYQEIGDIEFLRTLKSKRTLAEYNASANK